MKNKSQKGFTVLEFLIVLTIMLILVTLILPALGRARERSLDGKKVTDIKTIALGLEQYRQICGVYPSQIDENESCTNMQGTTLKNVMPNITELQDYFADPSNTGYYYVPLNSSSRPQDECSGFHLGVRLSEDISGNLADGDYDYDSENSPNVCGLSRFSSGFNGQDLPVYDIHR